MRLLPIIGLEIHVRLKTKSKLFCACANAEETTPPNTAICPICTGQPGSLPTLNQSALSLGVRTGLMLDCHIPNTTRFDRKHYFYPDLPKGYQISQLDLPIAEHGSFIIDVSDASPERQRLQVGITRAHLEEDAAKNIHVGNSQTTLVDFNRAGTPLIEIVTEPDLRSPSEAKAFLQELQLALRAFNISNADMEKGYMRCDANISLLPIDDGTNQPLQGQYNPKTEIKNLNSFRAVERALTFEIARQTAMLETNQIPTAATRGWNENRGETFEQRSKETSADYRFFPEPDLPLFDLRAIIIEARTHMRELPIETRARLQEEWGFSQEDATFFVNQPAWLNFVEAVMGEIGGWMEASDASSADAGILLNRNKQVLAKLVGGWCTSKLVGMLTQANMSLVETKITPENFAEFIHLLHTGKINSTNAQKLLMIMIETGSDPSHIMEEHALGQIGNTEELRAIIADLVRQNPEQVANYKAGKVTLIKWFVGCVMKATEGRANPEQVEKLFKEQVDDKQT